MASRSGDEQVFDRQVLEQQLVAAREALEAVQRALQILGDSRVQNRASRGEVKSALLELLMAAGANGLNARSAVEMARERSLTLERNTVSSLLSRFKRDGLVDHDGYRYRLREPASVSLAA